MKDAARILHQNLLEIIANTGTIDGVDSFCAKLCEEFGYDFFLYAVQIPQSFINPCHIIISGYPPEWRETYVLNNFQKIDPTVSHCLKSIMPLPWNQIGEREKITTEVLEFMAEARNHGLRSGVSFPVHTPRGEAGMLSLASGGCPEATAETTAPFMTLLHGMAFHIHEATLRAIRPVELSANELLTAREKECLLWSAEGKTSWETSQILGISERTVVFHLQNAAEKLQVSNRLHAVVRAVSQGLIMPAL